MKLNGQVALVTGGDKGIGKGIALALANEGVDVVINYHSDKEQAEETVAQILALGRRAFHHQADVTDEEAVKNMFSRIVQEMGTIDILVNNAGVNGKSPIMKMELDEWKKVIDTNLTSYFLTSREAVKAFAGKVQDKEKESATGKIICISSVHDTIPDWVNYASSKGGVKMFVRSLALELAPQRIRVVGISPGAIQTDINKADWDNKEGMELLMKQIPYKRLGKPEEVGKLAAFLASDDADYITGTMIYIDGGMTLYPDFAKEQ